MKKLTLIIILVLLAAVVVLHFIAASQAENQIDEAIQAQADSVGLSVEYSSVEVAPFRGNVTFHDVNIIRAQTIDRAKRLELDLRYLDFLNIYFGGVKYGLKQLTAARINGQKLSRLNRNSMKQISLGDLKLNYDGNMWEGLRAALGKRPVHTSQQIGIEGVSFRYHQSNSFVGNFKSDSIFVRLRWPADKAGNRTLTDSLHVKNTTWDPPTSFKKKYAFFIQGFGFQQDSIPIPSAGVFSSLYHRKRLQIDDGQIRTKLFTIRFDGNMVNDSTWNRARLAPLNVTLQDLSPQFKKTLSNIEQLLNVKVPEQTDGLHFRLTGPVGDPQMSQNQNPALSK